MPRENDSFAPSPGFDTHTKEPLRVIALTHRVPYPPDKGDKIRTFHLLSRLARRAQVHLVCLADPPDDVRHLGTLQKLFASVAIVPIDVRIQKLRALRSLASRTPLTLPIFHREELHFELSQRVRTTRPDVFYVESSSMAPYALRHSHVPMVMDFVDVDSEKWRDLASRSGLLHRVIYTREAWTLARFERQVATVAAVCTVASSRELRLLHRIAPESTACVLSNGVDTDYFTPRDRRPSRPSLVFFGAMDYVANVDAAVYLVRRVLPRVRKHCPDVTTVIAGARPTRRVQALAREQGVTVTGFVEDIRPYVQHSTLCVCPLRVARGIQNKCLEAMAMGVPVVTTPPVAEGIDARPGREIVVAPADDTGQSLAAAIVDLLNDPSRCQAIAQAARARVVERYDWQVRADQLFELLLQAARRENRQSHKTKSI